jgi:hypothetical protein
MERQKEQKLQTPMEIIDEKERYNHFKRLYNKEQQLLHVSQNPRKTKARAFEATAMEDWKSHMEHDLNQVHIRQEDLATSFTAAIRDNLSLGGETQVPPAGTISILTAISATTELIKCKIHRVRVRAMKHIFLPSFIMKHKEDSCQNF